MPRFACANLDIFVVSVRLVRYRLSSKQHSISRNEVVAFQLNKLVVWLSTRHVGFEAEKRLPFRNSLRQVRRSKHMRLLLPTNPSVVHPTCCSGVLTRPVYGPLNSSSIWTWPFGRPSSREHLAVYAESRTRFLGSRCTTNPLRDLSTNNNLSCKVQTIATHTP